MKIYLRSIDLLPWHVADEHLVAILVAPIHPQVDLPQVRRAVQPSMLTFTIATAAFALSALSASTFFLKDLTGGHPTACALTCRSLDPVRGLTLSPLARTSRAIKARERERKKCSSISPKLPKRFPFQLRLLSSSQHARRRHHHRSPFLMADPSRSSPTAAASGDALLAAAAAPGDVPDAALPVAADPEAEFGFRRPELGTEKLAGTVQFHERHVFLCYKSPEVWPSHVEAAESDRLPRLLAAAIKTHKSDLKKKTKLTICEGEDGTESSNGDVLIFPDMVRYRGLTHFDVDNFVQEVLVKDTEWLPGSPEAIRGSYVFVCCHGSRDKRCGVCGPALIKRFKDEISGQGLADQVSVSACSHVGGHKYAGNVIVFSADAKGEVTGHWYGYVTPDDVPVLLHKHIGQGEIVDHLWRGQMGLSEEQQRKALELKHTTNGVTEDGAHESPEEAQTVGATCNPAAAGGCCQGNGGFTCCQSELPKETQAAEENHKNSEKGTDKESASGTKKGHMKICSMPTWFETWERADTYAALGIVAAAASVFVAFRIYKNLS
ncbi:uncharacterized protein LOC102704032 [Oryza brachyantha]|nr:uncharacterized protein LOC102704032 [Oryza brachyantha]